MKDVDVSPDGERIATVGTDGSARLWEAVDGRLGATLVAPERDFGVGCCRFSPDGRQLAVSRALGEDREWAIELWDAARHALQATLGGHRYEVAEVAFSPDGRALASLDSIAGRLLLHDLASPDQPPRELFRHPKSVTRCGWSPDGVCVLTGGVDGIRVWEASSGALVAEFGIRGTLAGEWAFLPGTNRLVAQSDLEISTENDLIDHFEGDLALYEIETIARAEGAAGAPRRRLRAIATLARLGADACAYLAAAPDGRRVAATVTYSDDAQSHRERARRGGAQAIRELAWRSGWLGVWDVERGELLASAPFPGQSPCAFSPCGRWIAGRSMSGWLRVHSSVDARLVFSHWVGLFLAPRWCGAHRLALGESGGRLHLLRLEGLGQA